MTSATRKLLIFCGPSGSGKSTLINRMMQEFSTKFGFSVSHTTRKPRPGEIHSKHYYFTTKEDMQKDIKEGKFIENAIFSGNMYGTSKSSVDAVIKEGKICVLDIDMQGVKQIMKTPLQAWKVFIAPPSFDSLEARLRARNTETQDSLNQRLKTAKEELEFGVTSGNFDLVIINDNVDSAYNKLRTFIIKHLLNHSDKSHITELANK